ncbi:glycoside hydrolase family 65 protein [Brachybacterium sp. EF45031]|nr:glycoside hydrolase family 65 protein [Brachybacterium sillae]
MDLGHVETLFATANGYLGMRGTPEEGRDVSAHGTFINGFHETWTINHAESAFGFAKVGQTIVNVPDSTIMKLYVDDEPLLLSVADLEDYERSLDMRDGVVRRSLVWRTPAGKRVRVRSERMVSFTERHLALMSLEVTMLEGDAPVIVSSQILNRQDVADDVGAGGHGTLTDKDDPRRTTAFSHRVLEPQDQWRGEDRMLLGFRTAQSRMTLAVGAEHHAHGDVEIDDEITTQEDQAHHVFRMRMTEGSTVRIEKAVAYHTSRSVHHRELFDRCHRTLDRVREDGHDHYRQAQHDYLTDFWRRTDVVVAGHTGRQQAIRWNLFQLAQAAARSDGWGVPAKGLTGSGYEGHYFWDTDVYVVPFLAFTSPTWARNVLRFRSMLLPKARERARELAQRGALFPWRTINGEEASAYYAAGTAQYHIDADVAYAFATYADVTGDVGFHDRHGVRVLVETARMWADLGFWRHNAESAFHIHGVTGPDEYTTVVNNNLFTNVMAKYNLERAAEALLDLRTRDEDTFSALVSELEITPDEPREWRRCAAGMFLPRDESFGIHQQDDRFLDREVWDLSRTPDEAFPLLLNFHPLVIYRFQVLKQADVVLALFLRGAEFTAEEKRADFEYYDPITTGDSSLSAVVQSIMAAEVGYQDAALDYFRAGLYVDLADLHHNTADGVHIASAGGVWNALVHGFGGMRHERGRITFDPRLPADWPSLTFPLSVRGSRFRVHLVRDAIRFTLEDGPDLEVEVRGESVRITAEGAVVQLADQGPVLDGHDLISPVGVGNARDDGSLLSSAVPENPDSPWDMAAADAFEGTQP